MHIKCSRSRLFWSPNNVFAVFSVNALLILLLQTEMKSKYYFQFTFILVHVDIWSKWSNMIQYDPIWSNEINVNTLMSIYNLSQHILCNQFVKMLSESSEFSLSSAGILVPAGASVFVWEWPRVLFNFTLMAWRTSYSVTGNIVTTSAET